MVDYIPLYTSSHKLKVKTPGAIILSFSFIHIYLVPPEIFQIFQFLHREIFTNLEWDLNETFTYLKLDK
nr:MAG TPA: hypothetical protein [Caudoviricetes sp.]